jgi:hypothetical protein
MVKNESNIFQHQTVFEAFFVGFHYSKTSGKKAIFIKSKPNHG